MKISCKKMTAVILSIMIAVSMLSVLPVSVGATPMNYYGDGTVSEDGDYVYWIDDTDDTVDIIYIGSEPTDPYDFEVTVPSVIDGHRVKTFKGFDPYYSSCVRKLTLSEGITQISSYACFYAGLEEVTIPGSIESMGDHAFANCGVLEKVNISEGVTAIGNDTFGGCRNLTNITLPNSLKTIGEHAFAGCDKLAKITVPDITTETDGYAFVPEDNKTDITLPNGLTEIGDYAFWKCCFSGVVSKDTDIGSTIPGKEYRDWALVLPNSVEKIGKYAFSECGGVWIVDIPDSVTSLGEGVFSGCYGLRDIKLGSGLTEIPKNAFADCTYIWYIKFGNNIKSIGENAFSELIEYEYDSDYEPYASVPILEFFGSAEDYNDIENVECLDGKIKNRMMYCPWRSSSIDYDYDYVVNCKSNTVRVLWFNRFNPPGGNAETEVVVPSQVEGLPVTEFGVSCTYQEEYRSGYDSGYGYTHLYTGPTAIDLRFALSRKDIFKSNYSSGTTTHYIVDFDFGYDNRAKSLTIPNSVKKIYQSIYFLTKEGVYFNGTYEEWKNIDFYYCYSGSGPYSHCKMEDIDNIGYGGTGFGVVHFSEPYVYENDTYSYKIYPNDTVEILSYKGSEENINISSEPFCWDYSGFVPRDCRVTALASKAFYDNSTVKKVDVSDYYYPDFINTIGDRAFANCASLEEVDLGYTNIRELKEYTFYKCPNLTNVTLPNTIETIGNAAFRECSSLTSFTIPENVTTIATSAFRDCTALKSITVPRSLNKIAGYAFYNDAALTTIYYEGTHAEWNEIEINPNGNARTKSAKKYYTYEEGGVVYTYSLTSAGTVKIEAFEGTEENIVIPSQICGCDVTSLAPKAFYQNDTVKSVTIPNTVTEVGHRAFTSCANLEEVIFENGSNVSVINEYTFYKCPNLTNVTLPDTIVTIGNAAFRECSSLTSFTIPENVTTIATSAFRDCTALTSITIPKSVTEIAGYAFYNDAALTTIYYTGTHAEWNNITINPNGNARAKSAKKFYTYAKSDSEVYTYSLTSTGTVKIETFEGTEKNVVIPSQICGSDVEKLAYRLFYKNNTIESVIIPDTVTETASRLFTYCQNLKEVNFGNSLTVIKECMCYACPSLTTVTLPANVEKLETTVFRECTALESIIIPKSLKEIASYAFYKDNALTAIYYEGTSDEWNNITINASGNAKIKGPNSATKYFNYAG